MLRILLLALAFPLAAAAETVRIPGPDGPLEAEATLVAGARDAVVVIPGSGPVDRDGNAPAMGLASDSYRLLAEGLAAQGITVFRIDKRGFGGSAAAIADPDEITIAGYAEDARAWVRRAAEAAPCVWIAGHSEGGLVALVAAEDPPEALCGLILMATGGRPTGRIMIEQFARNPANAPYMDELKAIVADLEAGRPREVSAMNPLFRSFFSPGLQRYMIDLFSYDPVEVAAQWQGPVLIVQGDADLQVRPRDADLLAAALPQARRMDLPGVTHMLKAEVEGQPLATYRDPSLPLAEDLVPGIAAFIAEHSRAE